MKSRKELQSRLDTLIAQHRYLMRGKIVPTPQAQSLQRKILDLQDEIKRIDRDATERLALAKAPIDEILEVVAIPLLADVLNDVVAGVDAMLRRRGCQMTVFGEYTATIRHAALQMVDTLSEAEATLPPLLDVDDTMVDAVKRKIIGFIKQRMNIYK